MTAPSLPCASTGSTGNTMRVFAPKKRSETWRPPLKSRNALRLSRSLLAAILLTACTTGPSETLVLSAPLAGYSAAFQDKLATELVEDGPACDRVDPQPGCSARARISLDYLALRDRLRLVTAEGPAHNRTQPGR